jgi:hypothetical protein
VAALLFFLCCGFPSLFESRANKKLGRVSCNICGTKIGYLRRAFIRRAQAPGGVMAGKGAEIMTLYQHARTLFKQMIHNLSEDDWASRHLHDRLADIQPSPQIIPAGYAVSSLTIALWQMGLVRQSPDVSTTDIDP